MNNFKIGDLVYSTKFKQRGTIVFLKNNLKNNSSKRYWVNLVCGYVIAPDRQVLVQFDTDIGVQYCIDADLRYMTDEEREEIK